MLLVRPGPGGGGGGRRHRPGSRGRQGPAAAAAAAVAAGPVSSSGRGAVGHAARREDGAEGPILWLQLLAVLWTLLRIGTLVVVIDEGVLVLVQVGVDVAVGRRGVEAGDGVQRMRRLGMRRNVMGMGMVGMGEALQGTSNRRRRMVAAGRRPGCRNRP